LPRFTLRATAIVIAVAALATWGYAMRLRSAMFTAKASEHEDTLFWERINLRALQYNSIGSFEFRRQRRQNLTATDEAEIATQGHVVEYEERMYRKYARAARFPWLPIDPDPAPPTSP